MREEAAWILGEMKAEKAVDPLIQALTDKDMGWMAAMALGKIGSERAVDALIQTLKSEDIQKRRASAWAFLCLMVDHFECPDILNLHNPGFYFKRIQL